MKEIQLEAVLSKKGQEGVALIEAIKQSGGFPEVPAGLRKIRAKAFLKRINNLRQILQNTDQESLSRYANVARLLTSHGVNMLDLNGLELYITALKQSEHIDNMAIILKKLSLSFTLIPNKKGVVQIYKVALNYAQDINRLIGLFKVLEKHSVVVPAIDWTPVKRL